MYLMYTFAKSIDKNSDKNKRKSVSSKYSQKRFDYAKQSTTRALKTASKRATQKNSRENW